EQQRLAQVRPFHEYATQVARPTHADRVAFATLDAAVVGRAGLDARRVKGLAVDDPAGRLGETDPLDAALEPGGEVGRAGRHVGDQLGQAEDLRLLRA